MQQAIVRELSGRLTKASYNTLIAMAKEAGYRNIMPKYPKGKGTESTWRGYHGRFNNWYSGLVTAMESKAEAYSV